ncbi:MAG: hypothetical protein PWR01_1976 [Clostridiales bacterium]|jgi:putative FmdB family regulatory protein|nr:hypothetical protein [Clostridiales bacterium]MDN5280903.1 hypothetical protein [Candidatus Ozemobacter sp.]
MPLYEFFCVSCKKKFSVLCKIDERDAEKTCSVCGSKDTRRMVSRFKTVRSEEQLMENLADPSSLSGIDENDPKSMAAWAKKMAREMGENMDDEIDAMAEEEFSGNGESMPADEPYDSGDDQL